MAVLLATPAVADDAPPPDPELLELLGEAAGEDEGFEDYLLSSAFERERRRISQRQQDSRGNGDER
ncbi:MAG: hypothetical protein FJ191_02340 [Gammaproteobacteria bacterium]|nr:hypothetical protein [Gammaproteobacteria bacterium]